MEHGALPGALLRNKVRKSAERAKKSHAEGWKLHSFHEQEAHGGDLLHLSRAADGCVTAPWNTLS